MTSNTTQKKAIKNNKFCKTIQLLPLDNQRLAELCGPNDCHLRALETQHKVHFKLRSNHLSVYGQSKQIVVKISKLLLFQYQQTAAQIPVLTTTKIAANTTIDMNQSEANNQTFCIQTPSKRITPRNIKQKKYLQQIISSDLNFGIGAAGTGKTYLAVACAVQALKNDEISRIILVRPAVEAGEHLGFLPGDLAQKVDPYLRPLYDALHEMLGLEVINQLLQQQIIEIAPLAYMRGRTLNDAFVILDESQNTTVPQMKMFLTRFGINTKIVITGDPTQVDLPPQQTSGLTHAINILKDIPKISFTYFDCKDVVRHPLVAQIIAAYEKDTRNTC